MPVSHQMLARRWLARSLLFVLAACGRPGADFGPSETSRTSNAVVPRVAYLQVPDWTNSPTISVTVVRPPRVTGAFKACLAATARDAPSPLGGLLQPWTCGASQVPVAFAAQDGSKRATLTLPGSDGLKAVWVKFAQKRGTVDVTVDIGRAEVLLDTTPPSFGGPDAVVAEVGQTEVRLVFARPAVDAGVGLAGYKVVQTNAAAPGLPRAPGIRCSSGTPLACRPGHGELVCNGLQPGLLYSVRLCARDYYDNTSEGVLFEGLAPLPAAAASRTPTGTALTLTGPTNASTGGQIAVQLVSTAAAGSTLQRYCLAEAGSPCSWKTVSKPTQGLSLSEEVAVSDPKGAGRRTLVGRVADQLGRTAAATLSFDYDAAPPDDTSLDFAVGGADRAFLVTVGPSGRALAGPGGTFVASAALGAAPATGCVARSSRSTVPESFVLTASGTDFAAGVPFSSAKFVNGKAYRLRLCAVDAFGNVGGGRVLAGSFTYRAAPGSAAVVIGGGAAATASSSVALTLSARGIDGAKVVSYAVATSPSAVRAWQPLTTPGAASSTATQKVAAFDLGGTGPRSVYAWFKDDGGNETTSPASASVLVDVVKPTLALEAVQARAWGGAFQLVVRAKGTDDSGLLATPVVRMFPRSTATGAGSALACASVAAGVWDCASAPTVAAGTVSLSGTVADVAGNTSAPASMENVAIGTDSAAPTEASNLSAAVFDASADDTTVSALLRWEPSSDADTLGYVIASAEGTTAPVDCESGATVDSTGSTAIVVPCLSPATHRAFRVCAVDASGNVSPGATVVLAPWVAAPSPTTLAATGGGLTVRATSPGRIARSGRGLVCVGGAVLLEGTAAAGAAVVVREIGWGFDASGAPAARSLDRAVTSAGSDGRWSTGSIALDGIIRLQVDVLVEGAVTESLAFDAGPDRGDVSACGR